ncbi:class I SAM-dependent methyltransferase [Acidobacteriota bacterium]
MTGTPWQLQLVKRSLKKKEKLKLLEKNLVVKPSFAILDLGCAQGILSYFLRQKGGLWVSADQDFINLKTSQALLKKNIIQSGPSGLPFKSQSLDMVVSLDYLEHLENDELCLQEIHRILKEEGQLVLATPRTGRFFILHKLRSLLGMKMEFYGHKREGYSLKDLREKLGRANFFIEKHKTFSYFISEFLELLLNVFYVKFFSKEVPVGLRDGKIRPSTSIEFDSRQRAFKLYSIIYPFVWLLSRLDKLFFFQRGYGLMVWAKKTR